MRLKSTLWALAFACAAVSCSDDLEDGPNTGNENGEKGESAYIKVAVNTGAVTKATPGEDGDEPLEPGSEEESDVSTLAVFLFQNGTSTTDYAFKSTSDIKALGFVSGVEDVGPSGLPQHAFETEVEVSVTDPNNTTSQLADKKYGVIAVANITEANYNAIKTALNATGDTKNKGSRLADYLQTTAWTSSGNTYKDFVMSTHTMGGSTTGLEESTVTLVSASSSTSEAPLVNVYLERLAAKIRINKNAATTDFTYTIPQTVQLTGEASSTTVNDYVKLTDVAIVNKLNSGSHMLKRVSPTYDAATGELLTTDAASDIYLGDEVGNTTTPATNFVIDPWTRAKINTNGVLAFPATPEQLRYTNQYVSTKGNFPTYWSDMGSAEKISLSGVTDQKFLCYTMENTTSKAASINGYSTGALFQATYYPGAWGEADAASTSTNGYKLVSRSLNASSLTAADFYVYKDNVFKDNAAVFAYELAKAVPNGSTTEVNGTDYFTYKFFSEDATVGVTFDLAKFKASKSAKINDPFGYIEYLKDLPEGTQVTEIKSFKAHMNDKKQPTSVEEYTLGVCYYPYWIQHATLADLSKIGIMEFGIVRNNIYDLTVTGVNTYGYVNVPDPTNPDKDTKLRLNAVINVKNWVVRKNNNIIL